MYRKDSPSFSSGNDSGNPPLRPNVKNFLPKLPPSGGYFTGSEAGLLADRLCSRTNLDAIGRGITFGSNGSLSGGIVLSVGVSIPHRISNRP